MEHSPENKIVTYRYPGVRPFATSESELFFGREKDKEAFYNFMLSRQVVVLYGKSGYGKSSLINAGIIPKLQANPSNIYFTIRFNNFQPSGQSGVQPVISLYQRLRQNLATEQQYNKALNEVTNNEKTIWYWLKQIQQYKQPETIFLFFDQFEEVFTYPADQVNAFSEQLADAIYAAVPVKYRNILAEKEEKEELKEEELEWLFKKPEIKVVFSIRSDRMSLLNQISDRHISILANCFELLSLSEEGAKDAITKPASIENKIYNSLPFTYAPELIKKILESFRQKQGEHIESNILQIICRYIEDELVIKNKKTHIVPGDLGEISDILTTYYENILNKLDEQDRHKVQQLVEEKLITANQRNTLSGAFLKKEFDIDERLLEFLETSSLLRKERDASGRLLYEVSHDTLIEPIQKVAERRLKVEDDKKRALLEEQIQKEKTRVVQLENLNAKVRTRSRMALLIAILAIGVAFIAGVFYIRASKATTEARESNKKTLETLQNLNFQKAQELFAKANQFRDYQEIDLAKEAYSQGLQFLNGSAINKKDSALTNLEIEVDTLKNKILRELTAIDSNRSKK